MGEGVHGMKTNISILWACLFTACFFSGCDIIDQMEEEAKEVELAKAEYVNKNTMKLTYHSMRSDLAPGKIETRLAVRGKTKTYGYTSARDDVNTSVSEDSPYQYTVTLNVTPDFISGDEIEISGTSSDIKFSVGFSVPSQMP
jgi:hypothetical protein